MIYSVWPIACATLRGFSRDKIFHTTVLLSVAIILFAYFLSTLTIIETRKILLDFGFTAISLSGVGIAIFSGLSAVGKEIENRTIYTILAKPIRRAHYILGKYIGTAFVVVLCHVILSAVLYGLVHVDAEGVPAGMLACLFLICLESLFILAVAFLLSVSMSSSVLAASIAIGIFLAGRTSGTLMAVAQKMETGLPRLFVKGLWAVLPNLERFNSRDLVAYGKPLPEGMILLSTGYFLLWLVLLITVASLVFEPRDLP